jgi:hypothetical protein
MNNEPCCGLIIVCVRIQGLSNCHSTYLFTSKSALKHLISFVYIIARLHRYKSASSYFINIANISKH